MLSSSSLSDKEIVREDFQPGRRILPSPPTLPRGERARQLVLLVEDEPHDLFLYGTALWYNGFDVLEAQDGRRAVELAEEHDPDLVLVDIQLPELTGIEVCKHIRERGSDVPVVALTARDHRQFGPIARDAGCTGYLEKPISPLTVLRFVERLIGRAPPEEAGDGSEPGRETN